MNVFPGGPGTVKFCSASEIKKLNEKGKLMKIWKSTSIPVFIWKKLLKISYLDTFYFLRYAHVRHVKSLFTNIQKQ